MAKTKKISYSVITHGWNPYLVPTEALKSRPDFMSYLHYRTTEECAKAHSEACNDWIRRIERYYITPELGQVWGHEFGYGFKKKDTKKPLYKGVDFDVEEQDTIQHIKAAAGSPIVKIKGLVAVPIEKERILNFKS